MQNHLSDWKKQVMQSRDALPLPVELNHRARLISVFADWDTHRVVITSHPKIDTLANNYWSHLDAYYLKSRSDAAQLWRLKFGEPMPSAVEGQWAETTTAAAMRHMGLETLPLSNDEWDAVEKTKSDITLTDLWFVIHALGWRPGKPVAEEDENWIPVWADELECGESLACIRELLGMPEAPYVNDSHWMPPAVVNLAETHT